MQKLIYDNLPTIVKTILIHHKGWLVGNSIRNILSEQIPKDYDIIIEDRYEFQKAIKVLEINNQSLSLNSWGGIKFTTSDGTKVDIWSQELGDFLNGASYVGYIYSAYGILLEAK